MLPDVQLYHYKARVYDPRLGRFLQTDPVGYEDGWNLYAYVRNDPLNGSDPTGRECELQCDEGITLSIGVESEGAVGTTGLGRSDDVFVHIELGEPVTIGTSYTTRESVGMDVGSGFAAKAVPGGLHTAYAGRAQTIEFDAPSLIPGTNTSGEIGQTESGQPVFGVEIGGGVPGTFNGGTSTTVITNEFTFNKESTDSVLGSVSEWIQNIPQRIQEGLPMQGPRR